ncbi:MAG: hybrid sensor histidine kinase/response regulator [Verrucomicrobia bacterium]|nr:hybrid sensor histidine kinase/response regulator [Verrucomicrobiota bacterium]
MSLCSPMAESYDYKKFAILYVDDERESLHYFRKVFESRFRILVAPNAAEGFELLERHKDEIGILMTDERMPGAPGVQLLERARQLRPRIIRILVTAYSDFDAAIRAVNSGAIYRYVSKPWEVSQLEAILSRALEFFLVQSQRDQLLWERINVLREVIISDRLVSLGLMATGLSHHVRNSLVAIRTFIDLAPSKLRDENLDLENLRQPEFWNGFHAHVQQELERITRILSGLGNISESGTPPSVELLELGPILSSSVRALEGKFRDKSIQIDLEVSPASLTLTAGRQEFERLLGLLLADELVHIPANSRIQVRARGSKVNGDPHVILEIEDNGPSLTDDALRSLFDPFFLRSDLPHEHGINLMTCYFLVHRHGGKIDVRRAEPQGTVFSITLPATPRPPATPMQSDGLAQKIHANDSLLEKLLAGL